MANVFIHGLGQTPLSWEKTVKYMDFITDVYCPDLSEMLQDKDISYDNLYKTFSVYCDGIAGKINLCGLSLGAVIALQYAIEHPGKVESMILIAAQYKMPKMLLTFQNMIFRFMPKKMFQQMGFGKKDFIVLSKSMMNIDFSHQLKDIKCPVLLLCGEKDKANKKASIELSENLPNSKFQLIENSGHEVNIDNPEELAAVIHKFCIEGKNMLYYNN